MKSPRHRTIAKAGRVSICTSTIATAALVLAQAGWFATPASATIIGTPFGTQAPSGILSDNTGLTMSGGGQLLLDSGNSYTGATTINDGSVSLTAATALGTDTSTIAIAGLPLNGQVFDSTTGGGGGNLTVGGDITVTRNISIRGNGSTGATGALTNVGNNTFSGVISAVPGSSSRIMSTQGRMTISSTALTIAPGTLLQFGGNGNVLLSGNIGANTGSLQRFGGSGLLEISGTNNYSGSTTISGGFMRISDKTNIGTSTAANAITLQGGTLEIRTDAGTFATKGVSPTVSATIFLDHLVGSTAQNYTVAFKNLTQTVNTTTTLNGRNGYGATFTQYTGTGAGNSTLTNNLNGLLTIGAAGTGTDFWGLTDSGANRTLTVTNASDMLVNGAIVATAGASTFSHNVTKAGSGTLTIQVGTTSATSSYTGLTNINAGTLAINSVAALNNAATGTASQINIGATNVTGTLSFIGSGTAADYAVAKTINLNGTTGGAIINANQTSANPVLLSVISNSDAGTSAKTLTLGGTSLVDNAVNSITNSVGAGVTSLTKTGTGTWVLGGANTYTGSTFISGGTLKIKAGGSIAAASPINFTSNGTLEYANGAGGASTLALGALTTTLGAGTVTATSSGGAAGITFASAGFIGKGTGVNFVTTGSAGGAITLTGVPTTTATTLPGLGHYYFNATNFAVSTAGVLGAPIYTSAGPVFNLAPAGVSTLAGSRHNEIGGVITAQTTVAVTSLKLTAFDLTLAGNLTVNTGSAFNDGGILQSGGTANINGAGLITTGGAGAVVIRVDGAADVLSLGAGVNIGSTTTGGLTKNGAGTLVINGTNAQTGTTSINEGAVRLGSATARLSATSLGLDLRQGATLDLGGFSTGVSIAALNGSGTITNSGATPGTLVVGNITTGAGTFSGIIQDGAGVTNVTKTGTTGAPTWSGLNTYTGVTTIGGTTGLVSVPILANIGAASGIGRGVVTDNTTNAASLVFAGTTSGVNYTGTTSVKTDRLFTFNGSAAGSGGQIANSSGNNSSLIFNNPAALVFGTGATVAQTVTFGGFSTGDNVFNPLIGNNGTLNTSVSKVGTGLWILGNAANTYSGTTTVSAGTLRANDSSSLPAASNLMLAGGTFETSVNLTRTVGTGASQVQWTANGAGGLAAADAKVSVNIGGAPIWGTTAGFLGTGNLLLSSSTALNEVDIASTFGIAAGVALAGTADTVAGNSTVTLTAGTTAGLTLGQVVTNPNIPVGATISSITSASVFTLNSSTGILAGTGAATTVAPGGFRQITVADNVSTATDIATISGAITGDANLAKNGAGTLQLFGSNTYTGNTVVSAGTLNVKTLGNSVGAAGSSNVGATGVGAGAVQLLGGTLDYVGAGEISSRAIQAATTAVVATLPTTNTIRSNGTGALILTNVVNGADPAGRTIQMGGENLGPNEIQTVLADNGGPLRLSKGDGGIWVSGLPHTFTGGVFLFGGGTLGISGDPTPSVGAPTSGPLGTGTLSSSGGNIMAVGGDRHVTNSVTLAAVIGLQGDNSIFIDGSVTMISTINSTILINNFIVTGKTLTVTGSVQCDAAVSSRTLSLAGSGESIITGVVADGGAILSLGVNATGGGLLRLQGSAPNTYGGGTTLTSGTLSLEKAGAIPNGLGNVIALAGGTLQASSDAFGVIPNAIVNLNGSPTIAGGSSIEFQGTVTNNLGNRTITNNLPAGKTLTTSGTTNLSESTTARILTYAGTGQTQVTGLIQNFVGGTVASAVTKTGAGTLNITGTANTYSGVTSVTGGILNVASLAAGGAPSSIGQAAVAGTNLILNGGTLQYTGATPQTTNKLFSIGTAGATIDSSGTGSLSFTGTTVVLTPGVSATPRNLTLTGTNGTAAAPNVLASQLVAGTVGTSEISLTKAGTGTWNLSSATGNSYTGGTTISAGILAANNTVGSATGTGPVNLAGGDLGGSGTVSGSIVGSAAGGNVAPGNSIGTLRGASLNLAAGGGFRLEIDSNLLTSDQLILTGALTLAAGSPLTIADLNTGAGNVVLGTKFPFITYGGGQAGLFSIGGNVINDIDTNPGDTFTVGGFTYGIDYNDGTKVSLVAVPEPGTFGSLIAGCGLLLGLRRRRKV